MPNQKSDEELMTAYQLGDQQAFEELYRRYSGRVMGFLKSQLKDGAAAQDVFQGTLLKLHRSRAKYDRQYSFVAWLFTICRSELVDHLKKSGRTLEDAYAEVPEPESPPQVKTDAEDFNLASLSEVQQQALRLRYTDDRSFDEMALILGTSPSNARQILSRAVAKLRSLYGKN